MNLNPITAFKNAKTKRDNRKKGLSNGIVTLDNLTDVPNEYAERMNKLRIAQQKLPFSFRGLGQLAAAWISLGIRGAEINDKVVITSSSKDFFAFDLRKFFDEYHPGASIMINPKGFPKCRIICLDKSKVILSQLVVDGNSDLFAITKKCKFLTIKGEK